MSECSVILVWCSFSVPLRWLWVNTNCLPVFHSAGSVVREAPGAASPASVPAAVSTIVPGTTQRASSGTAEFPFAKARAFLPHQGWPSAEEHGKPSMES